MKKSSTLPSVLTIAADGTPYNTSMPETSAHMYCGHWIYATSENMLSEIWDMVDNINDNTNGGYIWTTDEKHIQRQGNVEFFQNVFDPIKQQDFAPETVVTVDKKKRVKAQKSPLFELLPQVFKGNGKVKRHPFHDKAKTSEIREIIRMAAKISVMTSVIIVLPVGTLQLSSDFKNLCVNSQGVSTFDLVIEEMLMQGWVIRGINLTDENSIDIA